MNKLGEHIAVWSHRYQLRRGERWQKRHDMSKKLFPRWRTPRRRKALIITFYVATTGFLLTNIAQIFFESIVALNMLFAPPAMTALVVLRLSINQKDSAPLDFLDEYEHSVLTTWRSIAYWLLCFHMLFFTYALTFVGYAPVDSPTRWVTSILLLNCSVFVLISSLPTIAYALTFSGD